MASIINAGTTTATALNMITDTTGELTIQTSGANAISISSSQVVTLANALLPASGGTGVTSLGTGVATALGQNVTGSGSIVLAASPTLTGTVTIPTPAISSDTTVAATTAFVRDIIPTGVILLWSGSIASIPTGWLICDGTSGTPDLRDRFIVGAGSTYAVAATGGAANAITVSHTHTFSTSTTAGEGDHDHFFPELNVALSAGGSGITSGRDSGGTFVGYRKMDTDGVNLGQHNHTVTGTTASTGSSGTNANLPPYYALAYIMKS
jgi:hypothetical protein